jgi:hypothetical protein
VEDKSKLYRRANKNILLDLLGSEREKLPQDCLWVSNCPYYDMISIYQQRRKLQMLRDGEEKAKGKIALISGRQDTRNMGSNLSNVTLYTHT